MDSICEPSELRVPSSFNGVVAAVCDETYGSDAGVWCLVVALVLGVGLRHGEDTGQRQGRSAGCREDVAMRAIQHVNAYIFTGHTEPALTSLHQRFHL